jgi:hypothetical protein
MTIIPYSEARGLLRVGDQIGCRGSGFVAWTIIKLSRGRWGLSHISTIIRDVGIHGRGRVEVLEAIMGKRGMQRNFLSKSYARDHGRIFWLRMHTLPIQQERILKMGEEILENKVKYDFKSIWVALFRPVFMDAKKFICSEVSWYLLTRCLLLARRKDEKGRELAPTPSEFPTWAGVDPVQLDMLA